MTVRTSARSVGEASGTAASGGSSRRCGLGVLSRISDLVRRHRPAVAAAMIGAAMIPALAGKPPSLSDLAPKATQVMMVDRFDHAGRGSLFRFNVTFPAPTVVVDDAGAKRLAESALSAAGEI